MYSGIEDVSFLQWGVKKKYPALSGDRCWGTGLSSYIYNTTTLIGLIQDGDESAYRQEDKELAVWCSLNILELNMLKTVEMIVDFRRSWLKITLDPSHPAHSLFELLPQKQFLSPSNPSHEHLILNMEHTKGGFSIRAIGRRTTKAWKEGIFLFHIQSQCYACFRSSLMFVLPLEI